jgi:hypothetical protein
MLFVLTGDIQIGKTRWLERLVDDLESSGLRCRGIISPGIWRTVRAEGGEGFTYEKLGIETLLLPERTRSVFALRRDIATREGAVDGRWQSSRAALGWAIPDEALALVNEHFDRLETQVDGDAFGLHTAQVLLGAVLGAVPGALPGVEALPGAVPGALLGVEALPGLLVIDELGRLELEEDEPGGFSSAVRLLGRGPTRLYQHALIVVRDRLAHLARARFAHAWEETRLIAPDEQARRLITGALGPHPAAPHHIQPR